MTAATIDLDAIEAIDVHPSFPWQDNALAVANHMHNAARLLDLTKG